MDGHEMDAGGQQGPAGLTPAQVIHLPHQQVDEADGDEGAAGQAGRRQPPLVEADHGERFAALGSIPAVAMGEGAAPAGRPLA